MISSGTTAILSVFAFLFLIPFVVDPAISAITADFDPGTSMVMLLLRFYLDNFIHRACYLCGE